MTEIHSINVLFSFYELCVGGGGCEGDVQVGHTGVSVHLTGVTFVLELISFLTKHNWLCSLCAWFLHQDGHLAR